MPITTYANLRETLQFYNDAYSGGNRWKNPEPSVLSTVHVAEYAYSTQDKEYVRSGTKSYSSYLVPHPSERAESYLSRQQFAAYINIVKPIVNAFAEGVTSNVKRNLGALQGKLDDIDYRGTPYPEFIDDLAKRLCVYGFCFVAVDTDGAFPKAINIAPTQVAWVKTNDFGKIEEFAYINQATYSNNSSTSEQNVIIRVCNANGWATLQGTVDFEKGFDPSQLNNISSTPHSSSLNGELPIIVCYYERDTSSIAPLGLSLISDTAQIAKMVYNLLSWAVDIHKKAGFPILTIPNNKTGGALDPESSKEVGPDRALGYNAASGSPQWIAPSSDSTKELREHTMFLIQWAFKLQGLELAADQSTQTVSGINLRVRAREFESKAKRFANQLQRFEERLLRMFAALVGVVDSEITVAYPKVFTLPDSTENITNALAVLELSDKFELGAEARIEAIKQVLSNALPLTDDILSKIMDEIRQGIEAEQQDFASERSLVEQFREVKRKNLSAQTSSAQTTQTAAPEPPVS